MANTSKYEEKIKPHLDDIRCAIEAGATIEEIAETFGVNKSTLYEYKKKYSEFSELFACGRKVIVYKIKNALLKKALGFEYEEESRITRKDKNGEDVVSTETKKKYCPPSETAAAMLLRNYDKEWRDVDKATAEIKQQEAKIRKEIAKSEPWDANL